MICCQGYVEDVAGAHGRCQEAGTTDVLDLVKRCLRTVLVQMPRPVVGVGVLHYPFSPFRERFASHFSPGACRYLKPRVGATALSRSRPSARSVSLFASIRASCTSPTDDARSFSRFVQ